MVLLRWKKQQKSRRRVHLQCGKNQTPICIVCGGGTDMVMDTFCIYLSLTRCRLLRILMV